MMRKATPDEVSKHRSVPRVDLGIESYEFYFIPHKKGSAEVLAEVCWDNESASVLVMNNKKVYAELSKMFNSTQAKEEAMKYMESL